MGWVEQVQFDECYSQFRILVEKFSYDLMVEGVNLDFPLNIEKSREVYQKIIKDSNSTYNTSLFAKIVGRYDRHACLLFSIKDLAQYASTRDLSEREDSVFDAQGWFFLYKLLNFVPVPSTIQVTVEEVENYKSFYLYDAYQQQNQQARETQKRLGLLLQEKFFAEVLRKGKQIVQVSHEQKRGDYFYEGRFIDIKSTKNGSYFIPQARFEMDTPEHYIFYNYTLEGGVYYFRYAGQYTRRFAELIKVLNGNGYILKIK